MELIRSCSQLPIPSLQHYISTTVGDIPGFQTNLMDLFKIQDHILSRVVGGSHIVIQSSIESLRIPFKFKKRANIHPR